MLSDLKEIVPDAGPTLVASIGLSPAVLTETIWALATASEDPVVPERVIVVTTSLGRRRLVEALFDQGGWEALLIALEERGIPVEGRLKFGNIGDSIRAFPSADRSAELDDIRSEADNGIVAETLCEIVRGLADDEERPIIASLAGGRKTTGALLHSVMTLFGRAQDRLTHVLVDAPFDRVPHFLFPGWPAEVLHPDTGKFISTGDARLRLAEVPFVPLRYLFHRDLKRSAGSYSRLIAQVRNWVLNIDHDLEVSLNADRGEVFVNGKPIQLSAFEFGFYLFFAKRAAAGRSPIAAYADLDEPLRELAHEHQQADDFGHWSQDLLEREFDIKEDARKWASSIRGKLRQAGFGSYQIDRLVPGKGHLAIQIPPEDIEITGSQFSESSKST